MAVCEYCGRDMLVTKSCDKVPIVFATGSKMDPIPYTGERCPDCGVTTGGYHHPGCDMEICPLCGGQLISCSCIFVGEG